MNRHLAVFLSTNRSLSMFLLSVLQFLKSLFQTLCCILVGSKTNFVMVLRNAVFSLPLDKKLPAAGETINLNYKLQYALQ